MELAAQGFAQGLLQQVVSGIGSGAVFASLALALVLIYRAMAVANFAQGEMAMFGTFIAYALLTGDFGVLGSKLTFLSSIHLNFWLVFVVTLAVVALVVAFFRFTKLGLAMRAAALYPESTRLLGVRTSTMLALGWGLAAAVGAVSGMLVAPVVFLDPNMMQPVLLFAF